MGSVRGLFGRNCADLGVPEHSSFRIIKTDFKDRLFLNV
jgi:hypothetical protein